jgi:hypothetical protein
MEIFALIVILIISNAFLEVYIKKQKDKDENKKNPKNE